MGSSYLFSHDGLHDSLTHLYAPSFIYDLLERRLKIAARNKSSIALIKVVTDQSLSESDIIECAERLSSQIRPDDAIGRMGYFEFLIVLSTTTPASSFHVALSTIAQRYRQSSEIQVAFSMIESQPHEPLREIFNRLDEAVPLHT